MRKILFVPIFALSLAAVPALAEETMGEHAGMSHSDSLSVEHVNQKLSDEGSDVRGIEASKSGDDADALGKKRKHVEASNDSMTDGLMGEAKDD